MGRCDLYKKIIQKILISIVLYDDYMYIQFFLKSFVSQSNIVDREMLNFTSGFDKNTWTIGQRPLQYSAITIKHYGLH